MASLRNLLFLHCSSLKLLVLICVSSLISGVAIFFQFLLHSLSDFSFDWMNTPQSVFLLNSRHCWCSSELQLGRVILRSALCQIFHKYTYFKCFIFFTTSCVLSDTLRNWCAKEFLYNWRWRYFCSSCRSRRPASMPYRPCNCMLTSCGELLLFLSALDRDMLLP